MNIIEDCIVFTMDDKLTGTVIQLGGKSFDSRSRLNRKWRSIDEFSGFSCFEAQLITDDTIIGSIKVSADHVVEILDGNLETLIHDGRCAELGDNKAVQSVMARPSTIKAYDPALALGKADNQPSFTDYSPKANWNSKERNKENKNEQEQAQDSSSESSISDSETSPNNDVKPT